MCSMVEVEMCVSKVKHRFCLLCCRYPEDETLLPYERYPINRRKALSELKMSASTQTGSVQRCPSVVRSEDPDFLCCACVRACIQFPKLESLSPINHRM